MSQNHAVLTLVFFGIAVFIALCGNRCAAGPYDTLSSGILRAGSWSNTALIHFPFRIRGLASSPEDINPFRDLSSRLLAVAISDHKS